MRTRAIFVLTTLSASAAAALVLGSGAASAAVPFTSPDATGVVLLPSENAAFAAGPIPGAIDALVPAGVQRVDLEPDSQLIQPDGSTFASTYEIAAEAAAHPGGGTFIGVLNPFDPEDPGAVLVVGQYW
ncbi:hypothetical protein ACFXHA_12685 [Nocardia sp. NPDC059240]|uniref:hypothetical protein n=1 Tax=Nocardia sp. NPDC059240 TaxID=3346786 RepID=UPI00367A48DB